MTQWQAVLALFKSKDNVLTTTDFAEDRKLSCEYRRALCELKSKGYRYDCTPIKKGLYLYRLLSEPVQFVEEPNGQLRMA